MGRRWAVNRGGSIYHVYPVGDLSNHNIEDGKCYCRPRSEEWHGSTIIIHNSFDGREIVERAEALLAECQN